MFFFTVYVLEMVGKGIWFRPGVRGFTGDYAYPVRCTTFLERPYVADVCLTAGNAFLDRLRSFPRTAEPDGRRHAAAYARFLPNCGPTLAHRLLESRGQLDIRGFTNWLPLDASFLLRSCELTFEPVV